MAERPGGAARAIRLDALIAGPLAGDEIHEALPTAPGVEPKTAATLVTFVNVSMFRSHNELATYTGLVPCNRQSGTSLNSSSPSRGDNGTLEIPPICSCASLSGRRTAIVSTARRAERGVCGTARPQSGGAQTPEGHLHRHAGQGTVPEGLAPAARGAERFWAGPTSACRVAPRPEVDKTMETLPVRR